MGNTIHSCREICSPPIRQSQLVIDLESRNSHHPRQLHSAPPKAISTDKHIVKLYKQELSRDDSWLNNQPLFIKGESSYYYGKTDKRGKPTGFARLITSIGLFYEGDFVNGAAYSEQGLVIYPSGSYYVGSIRDNKASGKGKLVYGIDKRLSYEGQWLNDLPHGKGKEILKDGEEYIGDFDCGVKDGKGHFKWANGDEYVGDFKDGFITGHGKLVQRDKKQVYEGHWLKNKKEGKGKETFADGASYEGMFHENNRMGQGVFEISGWRVHGEYKDGEFKQSKRERIN